MHKTYLLLFKYFILFNFYLLNPCLYAQKAFPGAEGAGAYAIGGRNGTIYRVTNLNSSGPGSFADAVSKSNRIIVFDVSGVIDMKKSLLNISRNNLTIAGQTAPGDGIWLKNVNLRVRGNHIIMRHLRVSHGYWGPNEHSDAITFTSDVDHVILDHISTYWGTDETLSPYNTIDNITVQNSLMAEGLAFPDPSNSPTIHGFGGILGSESGGTVTMHHCLWAHFNRRCPRVSGDKTGTLTNLIDYRNNVTYNCDTNTGQNNTGARINLNFVGNYLKYGPDTPEWLKYSIFQPQGNLLKMYMSENYIYGKPEFTINNWLSCIWSGTNYSGTVRVDTPFTIPQVTTENPEEAYNNIIEVVGASLPARSINDLRIVNDVQNGTGAIIQYETELSEKYFNATFYSINKQQDTDNDGIPDYWEDQFGLNKENATDGTETSADGYNNIEHYINNTDPTGESCSFVYISAAVSRAYKEEPAAGRYYVHRTGSKSSPLQVNYKVSGSAFAGGDYDALSGTVLFEAGQSRAVIDIIPFKEIHSGNRQVIVTVEPGQYYCIGCPRSSLIVIRDDRPLNHYLLHLGVNQEASGTVEEGGYFNAGSEVSLDATPAEGYRFINWVDAEGNPVVLTDDKFTMPAEDVALTAIFEKVVHTGTAPILSKLHVYPNPGNGLFHLEYAAEKTISLSIEVINITGYLVYKKYYIKGVDRISESIDLQHFGKGLYFLRISEENSVRTLRLVIN